MEGCERGRGEHAPAAPAQAPVSESTRQGRARLYSTPLPPPPRGRRPWPPARPDAGTPAEPLVSATLPQFPSAAETVEATPAPPGPLRSASLLACLGGTLLLRAAAGGAGILVSLLLAQIGREGGSVPAWAVGLASALFFATELLGAPGFGVLSDRYGRRPFLLISPLLGGADAGAAATPGGAVQSAVPGSVHRCFRAVQPWLRCRRERGRCYAAGTGHGRLRGDDGGGDDLRLGGRRAAVGPSRPAVVHSNPGDLRSELAGVYPSARGPAASPRRAAPGSSCCAPVGLAAAGRRGVHPRLAGRQRHPRRLVRPHRLPACQRGRPRPIAGGRVQRGAGGPVRGCGRAHLPGRAGALGPIAWPPWRPALDALRTGRYVRPVPGAVPPEPCPAPRCCPHHGRARLLRAGAPGGQRLHPGRAGAPGGHLRNRGWRARRGDGAVLGAARTGAAPGSHDRGAVR